jgi:hypothetical protein
MKHPGVISFDMLLGNPDKLKQYLLLYDELWVPDLALDSPGDYGNDPSFEQILTDLRWLNEEQQVVEPPIDLNSARQDEVTTPLWAIHEEAWTALSKEYPTAEEAALEAGTASFNIDMVLTRIVMHILWRDKGELAYPVIFPFKEPKNKQSRTGKRHDVLTIVLKQFPDPRPDLPLEDIVAFKRDPETQYKFKKLWDWIRKFGEEQKDKYEMEEEIDSLLTDYRYHLKHLTNKIKNDNRKYWVSLPGDLLEDVVKFQWGRSLGRLFELKRERILAHDEELRVPGSEIAYVKESIDLLSPRAEN